MFARVVNPDANVSRSPLLPIINPQPPPAPLMILYFWNMYEYFSTRSQTTSISMLKSSAVKDTSKLTISTSGNFLPWYYNIQYVRTYVLSCSENICSTSSLSFLAALEHNEGISYVIHKVFTNSFTPILSLVVCSRKAAQEIVWTPKIESEMYTLIIPSSALILYS